MAQQATPSYSTAHLRLRGALREEGAGPGETPGNLTDCLIAAVAIRNRAELLCDDADFAVLARHTALRIAEL